MGVGELADPANHQGSSQTITSAVVQGIYRIDDERSLGGPKRFRVYDPYTFHMKDT